MKKPPKYVKKARMYCVSEFGGLVRGKGNIWKREQKVHWFSDLEEADKFYKLAHLSADEPHPHQH